MVTPPDDRNNPIGSRLIAICSVLVGALSLLGMLGWKLGFAILLAGGGLFALARRNGSLLHLIPGSSAGARLLRSFLPLTVALILACGFLASILSRNTHLDPALLFSLSVLIAAVIVGGIIFRISRVIDGELARAEEDRSKAEKALEKKQEEMKLYLDTAGVMLLALNLLGRITRINRKGCEILGYNEKELLGRDWFEDCLPESIRDEAKAQFTEQISGTPKADDGGELTVLTKSGEQRILVYNHNVMRDELSRIAGILYSGKDITRRKLADEELKKSLEKLRRFLGVTVDVIERLVERRDLYTAGHQKRVADLSRAIATRMGLPANTIDAIRVTGSIHDVGKITIPSEILNKSSRLSDLEFGIIKTHPQVGSEIMSEIEFPWPVAQIILQHHERYNGSGYPQGLGGNDIYLEARIIAVADVVEAITSARPHRPAMSTEQALDEISQNRGTLYDPESVDACLKVFTEGYKFRM